MEPDAARRLAADIATELRKFWTFGDGQQHTHTWHDREDFIGKVLEGLIRRSDLGRAGEAVEALEAMVKPPPNGFKITAEVSWTFRGYSVRLVPFLGPLHEAHEAPDLISAVAAARPEGG